MTVPLLLMCAGIDAALALGFVIEYSHTGLLLALTASGVLLAFALIALGAGVIA